MASMIPLIKRILRLIELRCPDGYEKVWIHRNRGSGYPTAVVDPFVFQCTGNGTVYVRYPAGPTSANIALEFSEFGDIHECMLPFGNFFMEMTEALNKALVLEDLARI